MGARNLAHSNFLQSEGKNQRSRSGADEITGPTNPAQDPADCFSAILGGDGFHRETTYISPTRRNIETVFQLSLPPNEYFGTFDGLKRILKHFFFPPSLQLKLIPSGNRSIQILPIRVTNHEPFFLSFFLFLLPPRNYFTGKNKVE